MRLVIDLKHVGPRELVQGLIQDLSGRIEQKLSRMGQDSVSVRVVFEEISARRPLYKAAVTCHIPRHLIAAHEERRDAGQALRWAFKEVERQLDKQNAIVRRERLRRRGEHRP